VKRGLALAAVLAFACGCPGPSDAPETTATAERIVTLAPNLAELVHAVGAGERLVGVSAWSDYPEEVRTLPVVGDAFMVDQEQLALLEPDLLLVWESGTPAYTVDKLRELGYRVESIRTRGLDDIAAAIRRLGELTGHRADAEEAAAAFTDALDALRREYSGETEISVFYQVSARPLYTINREHYVSELIAICGGRNVFDDLSELAPTVTVEAVIDRDPEVMLASTDAGINAFVEWERWPDIAAIRYGNQYLVPADEIGRATPRVLVAAKALCLALRQARANRSADVAR